MEHFTLKTPETIKEELDQASDDMAKSNMITKDLTSIKRLSLKC
jgi:hypothetical protein